MSRMLHHCLKVVDCDRRFEASFDPADNFPELVPRGGQVLLLPGSTRERPTVQVKCASTQYTARSPCAT